MRSGSLPGSLRSTCSLETDTGWESVPLRSSRALVSLSHDTVVVGDVDELEEDVGSISCLEGAMDVEEENWRKNLLTSLEPRCEQSSPC